MAIDELTWQITAHYAPAPLVDTFEAVLRSWGKEGGELTPGDLAPIDQFHFGGAQATLALASLAKIGPHSEVLDVGGGFGGPARTLAREYGAAVTVLELSKAYCDVGEMLTRRSSLSDQVLFRHGDGLAMPFGEGSFNRVWTQQSSMNIADKARLYREIHRVLRPGGQLALYEVMAGTNLPLRFPVPWAGDPSISFLSSPQTIGAILTDIGFRPVVWDDLTDEVVATLREGPPFAVDAPGLHLVLGEDFRERALNGIVNLAEGRATLIRAVLERP
jgi:SAM-dependent methyltransferase